jgi:hypothetical protein
MEPYLGDEVLKDNKQAGTRNKHKRLWWRVCDTPRSVTAYVLVERQGIAAALTQTVPTTSDHSSLMLVLLASKFNE